LASAYALKPLIGLITLPLKLLPAALDPTAPKRVTDTYLDDKDLDARVRSAKALSAPREAFDELESEPSHSAT
jgi:hypothetical protein